MQVEQLPTGKADGGVASSHSGTIRYRQLDRSRTQWRTSHYRVIHNVRHIGFNCADAAVAC